MDFFGEYTNHGIGHIENVLQTIDNLIPDNIINELSSEDISVMILAVALHDIGMQTTPELFKNMINGEYNTTLMTEFDDETWNKLWEKYLKESSYWNDEEKTDILGDDPSSEDIIRIPDLKDSQENKEYNKKLKEIAK